MPTIDVEMTVAHVFVIPGRGTVAAGEAMRGTFRSGQIVQIWHNDQLLGHSPAHVELHARPGTTALLLTDPPVQIQPGYLIRGHATLP